MKMYLAIIRTNLDDLPLFLTNSYSKAKLAAFNVTEEQIEHCKSVMLVDASEVVCKAVVTFVDGVPQGKVEILEPTVSVSAKSSASVKPRSRRAAKN